MKIRLCDKTEEDYAIFSKGFHEIFEPKYFIDTNKPNPFKAKDNIYIYAETDSGELMGALNLIFLTAKAFEILKKGDVIDDMFLTVDDIEYLKPNETYMADPVYAYFTTIYVKTEFRGQGVALALVHFVFQWLKNEVSDRKIERLAYCLNEKSRSLLEDFGLKVIGKNLNDEWIIYG